MSDTPTPRQYAWQASGWSASINNADFWSCLRCGACIVEIVNGSNDGTEKRALHDAWHAQIDGRQR